MAWGKRTPERMYAVTMWIVSLALTSFLIGLGGLIIRDLPQAGQSVSLNDFVDQPALTAIDRDAAQIKNRLAEIQAVVTSARDDLATATANYASAYETFENWLATRTATTDAGQDPEVLSRTSNLDVLKERERAAQGAVFTAERLQRDTQRALAEIDTKRSALFTDARPAFNRAKSVEELRVFTYRLALTLPLLAISFWLVAKKRKSRYWPLMRGFVLFSAFAFFVELVPYLPSYGGYVRYGVGVAVTLLAGHFVTKWMRGYLDSRRASESQTQEARRQLLTYEDALKKIGADICPGCDRKILTTGEAVADFCVHCGMQLYNRCSACNTRKSSFFRYCMACGAEDTHAQTAPPKA